MGGSQEAEGDQQGVGADEARAAGGDADAGVGDHGHARWWDTRTIDGSSGADTEGMREVHGPLEGAQRVCGEGKGCMVREKGKAQACLLCQKAHKACIWPLGLAEAIAVTGSRTEGSGRPALRHVVKRRMAMTTNVSP